LENVGPMMPQPVSSVKKARSTYLFKRRCRANISISRAMSFRMRADAV
jgi:hypothetical protein